MNKTVHIINVFSSPRVLHCSSVPLNFCAPTAPLFGIFIICYFVLPSPLSLFRSVSGTEEEGNNVVVLSDGCNWGKKTQTH